VKFDLRLLGPITVEYAGETLRGFISDKARAVLAFIAMHTGRPVARERLAALFWPDQPEEKALKNLRQALSNLRKILGAANTLEITREHVALSCKHACVDALTFQHLVERVSTHAHRRLEACPTCHRHLAQAIHLYRGEFLEGLNVTGCPEFQEWVVLQRERFHMLAVEALLHLAAYHELHGEYAPAARYAERLLHLEPWNETSYRRLMRILALQGRYAAALKQYEKCRQVLEQELHIAPAPETRELAAHIRNHTLEITLTAPRHLPPALTPFFGREEESADLLELIHRPSTRLVTLVGMSGVGKSRLAAHVAEQAHPLFPDGVYWVPLDGVTQAARLPAAVAESLQMPRSPGEELSAQLWRYLHSRNLLLVLDSVEHLLPDVANFVHTLLRRAPQVVMLVTSHRPLRLQAEHVYPLHGLPVPTQDAPHAVAEFDSLRLFQDRARRMAPGYTLDEHTLSHAVRICQIVGGMPLGIELAAWNVHLEDIATLAERLTRQVQSLQTTLHDLPDRHRSLEAVFNYTWKHLPPEDQQTLARIAIFPEQFHPQDALAITGVQPTHVA